MSRTVSVSTKSRLGFASGHVVDQPDIDLLDAYRQVFVVYPAQRDNGVHAGRECPQRRHVAQPYPIVMGMPDRDHRIGVIAERLVRLHDSGCQRHQVPGCSPGQPCSTRRQSAGTADAP